MGAGTLCMHEAFETNNWYNDISTRDKSREGAEEAIDLSEGFKNPNYSNSSGSTGSSGSAPAAQGRAAGRGIRAPARALKLDINSLPQDRVSGVSPRVFWHSIVKRAGKKTRARAAKA